MKIESVNVTVFQYPTRRVSDSAGHSHPGVESMAKMAMLTITADDGAQGFSFAPPEVVRPFVVNTFFRKVLVGQDPFNRERIWQDLNHWQRGSAHQLTERALSFVEQALWDLIGRSLHNLGAAVGVLLQISHLAVGAGMAAGGEQEMALQKCVTALQNFKCFTHCTSPSLFNSSCFFVLITQYCTTLFMETQIYSFNFIIL